MKLFLLCVLFVAAVVAEEASPTACAIDREDLESELAIKMAVGAFKPCFRAALTGESAVAVLNAKSLSDFRSFASQMCETVPRVVACMAAERERLANCSNREIAVFVQIFSDVIERILPGACENGGERLGYIGHSIYLLMDRKDTLIPLRRCLHKVTFLLKRIDDAEDIDLPTASYLVHKQLPLYRNCIEFVEDDAYKAVAQWLITELTHKFRCDHPEEDILVPCSEIDTTLLNITSICQIAPPNEPHLYDHLEKEMVEKCYGPYVTHDKGAEASNATNLDWLREEYKTLCKEHRMMPECLLEKTAMAEACLSPEESSQFQLFGRAMEDLVELSCKQDGATLANVMWRLYQHHPDALRECRNTVLEARGAHHGHAVSSKNMRFYHEKMAFKQCMIDKLQSAEHSEVAVTEITKVVDELLKKIKCVNPEDGTVVLCESIHHH